LTFQRKTFRKQLILRPFCDGAQAVVVAGRTEGPKILRPTTYTFRIPWARGIGPARFSGQSAGKDVRKLIGERSAGGAGLRIAMAGNAGDQRLDLNPGGGGCWTTARGIGLVQVRYAAILGIRGTWNICRGDDLFILQDGSKKDRCRREYACCCVWSGFSADILLLQWT